MHRSMQVAVALSKEWKPASVDGLPDVFTGGWVGYCGYDTVRYVYSSEGQPPLESWRCTCRASACCHGSSWTCLSHGCVFWWVSQAGISAIRYRQALAFVFHLSTGHLGVSCR